MIEESKHRGPWTTFRELEFLDGLGKHRPMHMRPRPPIDRRILLRKYMETMHLRVKWGAADPGEIISYLRKELGDG